MTMKKAWVMLLLYAGATATPSVALAQRAPPTSAVSVLLAAKPMPVLPALRLQEDKPETLEVKYAKLSLTTASGKRKSVYVRTYNGQPVGPVLRAKPGQKFILDLVNSLPDDPDDQVFGHHDGAHTAGHDPNKPGGFNVTNLHFHGLHVRPDYPSRCDRILDTDPQKREKCGAVADNVMIEIKPVKQGATPERQRYEIEVPLNQPPGTHWYHAHKHGSVAMQLASGMAGAFIVEGGLDDVPGIKGITEQVMVFQQLTLSECGRKELGPTDSGPAGCKLDSGRRFESCETYYRGLYKDKEPPMGKDVMCVENFDFAFGPNAWNDRLKKTFGASTMINGEYKPEIQVRQGEVQRWRLLHAGIRETLMLGLIPKTKEQTQKGLAALEDGARERLPLRVIAHDGLATGRMDEQDKVELEPGYRVDVLVQVDKAGDYELVDLSTGKEQSLRAQGAESFDVLADVKVLPSTTTMPLPNESDLKAVAYKPEGVEDAKVTGCQYVTFSIPPFTVNGQPYGKGSVRKLPFGQSEEWVLNSKRAKHPFHIHVNPFQLMQNYHGLPKGTWKDTLLVHENSPVRIRTDYEDFTGRFVLHCHILDHEDQGMMQEVEIVASPKERTSCPVFRSVTADNPLIVDSKNPLRMCLVPPLADGQCSPKQLSAKPAEP